MQIRVGLENGIEGRTLAWALDYPGCFTYGKDEADAILHLPKALIAYANRIAQHTQSPWLDLKNFDVRVVQTWQVYFINENYEPAGQGYEVNAWFQDDWKPLQQVEIDHALQLLRWNREDLLNIVSGLSEPLLDQQFPGERWSVRGILKHIGGSEWWYLNRLGLAGIAKSELPEDAFTRLSVSRAQLESALPGLVNQEQVRGTEGELWSPRKLLRRALWHEMDHIEHILKLILK
jgi:hypothetical protein